MSSVLPSMLLSILPSVQRAWSHTKQTLAELAENANSWWGDEPPISAEPTWDAILRHWQRFSQVCVMWGSEVCPLFPQHHLGTNSMLECCRWSSFPSRRTTPGSHPESSINSPKAMNWVSFERAQAWSIPRHVRNSRKGKTRYCSKIPINPYLDVFSICHSPIILRKFWKLNGSYGDHTTGGKALPFSMISKDVPHWRHGDLPILDRA